MPGGLIQLVARGPQDMFLTSNPILTFFKSVYKKHTNFAMEHISQEFTVIPSYSTTSVTTSIVKIDRDGDLINDIYLVYDLPDIYSTSYENFRWIKNIGQNIINKAEFLIGGQLIDRVYSQWLNIWNELTLTYPKRIHYDHMIGNHTNDHTIYNGEYSTNINPSVKRQRLYIPLDFWFTRDSGLAVPLIALQYIEAEVRIEFNPLNTLFTMGPNNESPTTFFDNNDIQGFDESTIFWKFVNGTNSNDQIWNQRAYIDIKYTFLDTDERLKFSQSTHEYLITQTQYRVYDGIINSTNTLDIILQNPTIELVWVLQRTDVHIHNDWNNYSSSLDGSLIYETSSLNIDNKSIFDNGRNIMYQATLLFNGNTRFETKDHTFFEHVQPYKYHNGSSNEGINMFSFSLNPENQQPSGSCNMSVINKIELQLQTKDAVAKPYHYNLYLYARTYNVLRIMSGLGSLVFAN
jgi:hypothetical protein